MNKERGVSLFGCDSETLLVAAKIGQKVMLGKLTVVHGEPIFVKTKEGLRFKVTRSQSGERISIWTHEIREDQFLCLEGI